MSPSQLPLPESHDARHGYCEKILQDYHKGFGTPGGPGPMLPPSPPTDDASPFRIQEDLSDTCPVDKIAIVGAGVAGLYAVMMLSVNCKVDVFEANERVGERLFHYFEKDGKWDYFISPAYHFIHQP